MASTIELIDFGQTSQLAELARLVWENSEPGFQIDGVNNIEKLVSIFGIIKRTALGDAARFVHFNASTFFSVFDADGYGSGSGAHTDSGIRGLAVHQDLLGSSPLALAVLNADQEGKYMPSDKIDLARVSQYRHGDTIPGRLTIFSEGNGDARPRFPGLRPTVHNFRRSNEYSWVRYYTSANMASTVLLRELGIKRSAAKAFKLLQAA